MKLCFQLVSTLRSLASGLAGVLLAACSTTDEDALRYAGRDRDFVGEAHRLYSPLTTDDYYDYDRPGFRGKWRNHVYKSQRGPKLFTSESRRSSSSGGSAFDENDYSLTDHRSSESHDKGGRDHDHNRDHSSKSSRDSDSPAVSYRESRGSESSHSDSSSSSSSSSSSKSSDSKSDDKSDSDDKGGGVAARERN
ncbi:MAG: hypothetical protein ACAI34_21360 [Verrucomicrobium sp.]